MVLQLFFRTPYMYYSIVETAMASNESGQKRGHAIFNLPAQ